MGNGGLMDRRNEELAFLKKNYRREKRSATGGWKFFFTVSLLLCLVSVPGCLQMLLPRAAVTLGLFYGIGLIPGGAEVLAGMELWLAVYSNIFWIILSIGVLVLVVSLMMWIIGSSKLKRTDAFLSYRTLKEALREEKALNGR